MAHPNPQALPRRLGRYALLARLDQGGMTEVYAARLAEEVGPGRLLVIKLLPQAHGDDPDAEARFLEEARIVLNLTHGNISAAFEFGREEGRPFLVMEYVPGPSLRSLIDVRADREARLPVADALFVVREVSRALAYAHAVSGLDHEGTAGIVHRDVSPDNILISTAGQVKLTDFGIAQLVSSGRKGAVWGKAAYLAPELASGGAPSPASDIYSLGAVLYEALVGVPPLRGDSDEETLSMLRTEEPAPVGELRQDLPEGLEQLVSRLLVKEPAERPGSASELEVELGELLGKVRASYTETTLARTVQECFPSLESIDLSRGTALREAMRQAGAVLAGGESTAELLATRTVPLADGSTLSEPAQEAGTGTRRRVIALMLFAFAAAIAAFAAVMALGPEDPRLKDRAPVAVRARDAGSPSPASIAPSPPRRDAGTDAAPSAPVEVAPPGKPGSARKAASRRKETARASADPRVFGWVNVNSSPWSYVSVNGKRLGGHTPFKRLKLPTGEHTLVFENPELGLKAVKRVQVKAWEETTIGARLE